MDQESAFRAELYRCWISTRLKVPILVQLTEVNGGVSTEAEVKLAVRGLKGRRSGGLSGMREEDLKGWRKRAKQEKETEGKRWDLVVRLVHVMFRDGTVP